MIIVALILSIIICYALILLSKKNNWIEQPRQDRWHNSDVPKYGGVAIFLSFIISILIYLNLTHHLYIILISGTVVFSIGLIDDVFTLKPVTKMLSIIVIAIICFFFEFRFFPSGPIYLSLPLTILWYAGIINAINIIDNMDGLSSGTAIITLSMIIYFTNFSNQLDVHNLSLALLFSCAGFLLFNFYPAKIFMGDSGSLFIGFMLATFALEVAASYGKNILATLTFPVLLMAYPIFDTALVTINRLLNKTPISKGGKDHSSHRLVKLGIPQRTTVIYLYLISFIFGVLAVSINYFLDTRLIYTIIILFVVGLISLGIFMSIYMVKSEEEHENNDQNVFINNNQYLYKKQIIELFLDALLIISSFTLSHFLRFELDAEPNIWELHDNILPLIVIVKLVIFYLFKLYGGIWKYASIADLVNILKASTTSTIIISFILFALQIKFYSRSVFIIDSILTFIFISFLRLIFRVLINSIKEIKGANIKNRILVIGPEDVGQLLTRYLINSPDYPSKPYGLITEDSSLTGRRVHGVPILGTVNEAVSIIKKKQITHIITAMNQNNPHYKAIREFCNQVNITHQKLLLKIR